MGAYSLAAEIQHPLLMLLSLQSSCHQQIEREKSLLWCLHLYHWLESGIVWDPRQSLVALHFSQASWVGGHRYTKPRHYKLQSYKVNSNTFIRIFRVIILPHCTCRCRVKFVLSWNSPASNISCDIARQSEEENDWEIFYCIAIIALCYKFM